MKFNLIGLSGLVALSLITVANPIKAGNCNFPDDLDSAGHRCGKRAASERPGGSDGYSSPSQPQPTQQPVAPRDRSFSGKGRSYRGFCRVNPGVFIRSRASVDSAILDNTGNVSRDANVYGISQQGNRLWAHVNVSFAHKQVSGWVRESSLYGCNDSN